MVLDWVSGEMRPWGLSEIRLGGHDPRAGTIIINRYRGFLTTSARSACVGCKLVLDGPTGGSIPPLANDTWHAHLDVCGRTNSDSHEMLQ